MATGIALGKGFFRTTMPHKLIEEGGMGNRLRVTHVCLKYESVGSHCAERSGERFSSIDNLTTRNLVIIKMHPCIVLNWITKKQNLAIIARV